MKGDAVLAFALTYRKKMTDELGHLTVEEYGYWETFPNEFIIWFAPTHEGERSLAAMEEVLYIDNIDQYLLEMENHNPHVGLSGVALSQILSQTIPKDRLPRHSMKEYKRNIDWIATLTKAIQREETFLQDILFKHDHAKGKKEDANGQKKRMDSATTKPKRQQKEYTAEEKVAYKLKKKMKEKKRTKPQPRGKS